MANLDTMTALIEAYIDSTPYASVKVLRGRKGAWNVTLMENGLLKGHGRDVKLAVAMCDALEQATGERVEVGS